MKVRITQLYPVPVIELEVENDLDRQILARFGPGTQAAMLRPGGLSESISPYALRLTAPTAGNDGPGSLKVSTGTQEVG